MDDFQIIMMISNKFYLTDCSDELSIPSVHQIDKFIDYLSIYIHCQADENTFIVQDEDLIYLISEMKDGLKNKCIEHNIDLRGVIYQTEPVAQVDLFCSGEFGLLLIEPVDDNDRLLYDYLKNTEPSY